MTPEEKLDEARAEEALRIWNEEDGVTDEGHAVIAARLAREGWTPPEPVVDPDLLAFRAWMTTSPLTPRPSGDPNRYDDVLCETYLAGARMAREQERERAKVLEAYVKIDEHGPHLWTRERARKTLAKYRGEA